MTFLELCQELVREAGIISGLTTTISQTGEYAKVVKWITQSWTDIQTARPSWKFMWSDTFAIDTVVGESQIDVSSSAVARFDNETFSAYEKAVGTTDSQQVYFEPWSEIKSDIKQIEQDNQRPSIITRRPNGKLDLVYPADKIYTITADIYRDAQIFSADAEVPTGLPTEYHMAIVYKALFDYGAFEDAPEQVSRARDRYNNELFQNMLWTQQEEPILTQVVE